MGTTTKVGICPACNGSTRKPVPEHLQRWKKTCAGYDPETDTFPCTNCGGQTMSLKATGQVPLRSDGTPCLHEYVHHNAGRCLHEYTCKYCSHHFFIDSSD